MRRRALRADSSSQEARLLERETRQLKETIAALREELELGKILHEEALQKVGRAHRDEMAQLEQTIVAPRERLSSAPAGA